MSSRLQFGTNVYKFPQFGPELEPLVTYVKTAERLGFHHMRFLDHVVGIVAEKHGGIAQTPYTNHSIIREVFTLMAYLSAVTTTIRFVTGVLALRQHQHAGPCWWPSRRPRWTSCRTAGSRWGWASGTTSSSTRRSA